MKKVASLRYGVIFKKAFCDPEIFTAFVRDIAGVDIEIDMVETEKEFDSPVGYVKSRFDLFAQDQKNRLVVDVQHERYSDHYDRFMHYHMAAVLEQVKNAYDYTPPMSVFTIVVLTSGDKHKKDIAVTDFDPRDREGNALGEINHKVMYLCPKYVNDETPEPFRSWLLAIRDTLDEEVDETVYQKPEIRKIFDHIEKDSVSPAERAEMFDEHGHEKLQEEKFAEGIAEGERRKALETALSMLQEGLDAALITKVTGLTPEDIQALT
ncbi:PD-(D/E)XK nuclease family transposase [Desulfococcaceae bacterium HSG8]|nr:PD-(D/E)XK nuclease family transposase [Desulfococcaceae bacterium HSG8]